MPSAKPSNPDPADRSTDDPVGVLFVCLGNICRSPLAEGIFRDLLEERGLSHRFRVDSAGTGAYHVGEPPDPRSRRVAQEHGVTLEGRARQVRPEDFQTFDYVIAMDRENLRNLERLEGGAGQSAALHLLREFDPEGEGPDGGEVPDPYYGGPDGFERVYRMVRRSCRALLDELAAEKGGASPPPGRP